MQTTVVNYFDDQTNERVATKFYVGSEEVSFDQYAEIIEDLIPDEVDVEDQEVENGNMDEILEEEHEEDCTCPDCQENRKMIYLAETVKFLFENELCPKHVFELLGNIYDKANYEGYEEGYEAMKTEMKDYLED